MCGSLGKIAESLVSPNGVCTSEVQLVKFWEKKETTNIMSRGSDLTSLSDKSYTPSVPPLQAGGICEWIKAFMFLQMLLSQPHHVGVILPHLQDVTCLTVCSNRAVQAHLGFLNLEQFCSVISWASPVARLMGNFPDVKLWLCASCSQVPWFLSHLMLLHSEHLAWWQNN